MEVSSLKFLISRRPDFSTSNVKALKIEKKNLLGDGTVDERKEGRGPVLRRGLGRDQATHRHGHGDLPPLDDVIILRV